MKNLLVIGALGFSILNSGDVFGTEEVMSVMEQQSSKLESFDIIRIKEQMVRFNEMINKADMKLANELIAEDAPFYTPAFPEAVYGGKGYLSLVFWLRKSFPDVQWQIEEMIAEKNKVAVSWICRGTHTGDDFMGISQTGKTFSARFMNIYTFNESYKITSDTAAEGMIAILGALKG